jgi:sulfate adenylyltransferase
VPDHLVAPHGGSLVDLMAGAERAAELRDASRDWPSWDLTARQLCDLELLVTGGFSPLTGFLGPDDHRSVCSSMRLADGTLWPLPVTLDVPPEVAGGFDAGASVALRDPEGVMLAALHVEAVYAPDRAAEAYAVFGTGDPRHPGVARLLDQTHPCYIGGRVEATAPPVHHDHRALRLAPAELRQRFAGRGWRRVAALHTRRPLHRAQVQLAVGAATGVEANLLIHPSVGPGDAREIDHYTRVRCYQAVVQGLPEPTTMLAVVPLAARWAGPREALWHAIIRQNHGASHFVVGADPAAPAPAADGRAFYPPFAAQELIAAYQGELGIQMVPSRRLVYVEERSHWVPEDEVPAGARTFDLPEAELRRRLERGGDLPAWFTYPAVADELRRSYPPRTRQGITIFFTGLSGSGKSTIAGVLVARFREMGGRAVTLLDGDLVRKHLSSELGFSREHRDMNIRRIAFVAAEITRNGGVAICAPIAPYESVRAEARAMIDPLGGFVLVHVATPLEVCEQRDRKGLYAKARAGLIKEFTGISDPFEPPPHAEVTIDTGQLSAEEAAQEIILHLEREGYVAGPLTPRDGGPG